METGPRHVAVSVRELDGGAMWLGRAVEGDPAAIPNADVRAGRSFARRERFASDPVRRLVTLWVPEVHCYVVYTEHLGEDFLLAEGPLDSWDGSEARDGAL
jgi:hypothetical protein